MPIPTGLDDEDLSDAEDDIREKLAEAIRLGKGRAEIELGISFGDLDPSRYANISADTFKYIQKLDKELAERIDEAIRESKDYSEVERMIRDDVEPTYLNRAETIAVTELARVHSEAYGEMIRKTGLSGKYIFHASPDEDTCEECESLDGQEFESVDEIPVHPNCRCWWAFEADDESDVDDLREESPEE